MKTTEQILRDGREIVASRWVRKSLHTPGGSVCAMGALSVAVFGRAGYLQNFQGREGYLAMARATDALASVLPPVRTASISAQDRVVAYNDALLTSQDCMLAAFDAAIAKVSNASS